MVGQKIYGLHSARIKKEYGKSIQNVMRDLFDHDVPYQVIANVIGISASSTKRMIKEWGWKRGFIVGDRPRPTQDRLSETFGHGYRNQMVSDRKNGMTICDIMEKYRVSVNFVFKILRLECPELVGDKHTHTVFGMRLSDSERQRRSAACKKHNEFMKEHKLGWFKEG